MVRNNIVALVIHVFVSFVAINISRYTHNYELVFYQNLLLYLIFHIPYFLFGFVFGKQLNYFSDWKRNLLSFSSIFFAVIFMWVVSFFTIYGMPYILILAPAFPMFEYINNDISTMTESFILIVFTIPYILLIWLGQEARRKI